MSFRSNLVRARSHVVFVLALVCGAALILYLEGIGSMASERRDPLKPFEAVVPLPVAAGIRPDGADDEAARIAWTYFRNNTDPTTGLAGSVDGYPSTTMWETASYLVAIISAERLAIIDRAEAVERSRKVVDSLSRLALFEDSLPHKAYDIRTLQMVEYANRPTTVGLGWSALDIARLLSALKIVQRHHPELAQPVEKLVSGWDLNRVVRDGWLNGANVVDGAVRQNQEGRIGYERYGAKGMIELAPFSTGHLGIAMEA